MKKNATLLVLVLFCGMATVFAAEIGAEKLKAIRALMDEAASGKNKQVTYILSGDSTRDSYVAGQEFIYGNHLAQINITYVHNAKSGLRAHQWVRDQVSSSCLAKAISSTKGDGENTIMEFSLGINDVNGLGAVKAKQNIIDSIAAYIKAKPKAHVFLVVPVSYKTNLDWTALYLDVAKKFDLPLLNQGRVLHDAFFEKHDRFYYDGVHPCFFGATRLTRYILDEISGPKALSGIVWTQDFFAGSKNESADVNLAEGKKITPKSWYWPHNASPTLKGGAAMAHPVFSSLEPISVNENSLLMIAGADVHRVSMIDNAGALLYSFAVSKWKNHEIRYVYVPEGIASIKLTLNKNEIPVLKYLVSGELAALDAQHIYYQIKK